MSDTPKDTSKPSGPVTVQDMTVTVERDLCIGAATCLALAPEVFALDNEAKAIVLDSADGTSAELIVDAARACPTAAITVKDKNGEQLFP